MELLGNDIRELVLSEGFVIEYLRRLDHGKETLLFESDTFAQGSITLLSCYLRLYQTIGMIDKLIRDGGSFMSYELIVSPEMYFYTRKFSIFIAAGYNTYRENQDIIWLYLPMKPLPIKGTLNCMIQLRDYIDEISR